jgi:pilus assembly protein Flp/PilA
MKNTDATKANLTKKLTRDERGATLMEYIMLAGLVAIAAFAGFKLFGQDVQTAISGQASTVSSIPTTAQ